jgi:tetratricopeptide (TPR) repeat protein
LPAWHGLQARVRQRPYRAAGIIVACLVLAGLGYFVAYPQVWGWYHWRQAQQAIAADDLHTARTHLQVCAAVWPKNAETHFQLARVCRRQDDLAAAANYLRTADQLKWPVEAIDLEGRMLRAQGGAIAAVEGPLLEQVAAGHHEEVLILEALVRGYLAADFLRDASHWAETWIERYPADWRPWHYRGRILQLRNLADNAIVDYHQALQRKPDSALTRLWLAGALADSGRYAEALQEFRSYLQGDPDNPVALMGVARCLHSLSDYPAAEAALTALLDRYPKHAAGHVLRGQLELSRDRPAEALLWLKQADDLAPNEQDTTFSLAAAYRRLGQHDDADRYERKAKDLKRQLDRLELLGREISARTDTVALRHEAAKILFNLARYDEGARFLEAVLQEDPAHRPTHQALAEYYQKRGDAQRAELHRRAMGR